MKLDKAIKEATKDVSCEWVLKNDKHHITVPAEALRDDSWEAFKLVDDPEYVLIAKKIARRMAKRKDSSK